MGALHCPQRRGGKEHSRCFNFNGSSNMLICAQEGTVLSKEPHGPACRECLGAFFEAARPGKPTAEEFADAMAYATAREANMKHVLRKRGVPSYHVKHSALATTQFSLEWQETYTPVDVSSLGNAATSLPRLGGEDYAAHRRARQDAFGGLVQRRFARTGHAPIQHRGGAHSAPFAPRNPLAPAARCRVEGAGASVGS